MERLTQKNEFFEYVLPEQNIFGDNQATEISLGETEYTCKKYIIGEAINKLGELEDVLEKYRIENLDDFIKEYSSRNIKLANDNYILEQELAELKQKAIVPKFKPFQKIYVLIYNDNGKCFIVEHTFSGYSVNYCARERIWIQCTDSDKSYMLSSCFATKEEAEQKLAEIKGEKDE